MRFAKTTTQEKEEINAKESVRELKERMGSWTSSTISIGTLVVDMYDPSTKQLVWTGYATKTIDPSSDPEKNAKKLDKATGKLLKSYPPKEK